MGTRPLWLIAKQRCNGLEVFTIGSNVLPVFSFREEAEMFLGLGYAADGWQLRETTCGELVSVLYGPCRKVEYVALDPVPDLVALVSLNRNRFISVLLSDLTPPAVETIGVASSAESLRSRSRFFSDQPTSRLHAPEPDPSCHCAGTRIRGSGASMVGSRCSPGWCY